MLKSFFLTLFCALHVEILSLVAFVAAIGVNGLLLIKRPEKLSLSLSCVPMVEIICSQTFL